MAIISKNSISVNSLSNVLTLRSALATAEEALFAARIDTDEANFALQENWLSGPTGTNGAETRVRKAEAAEAEAKKAVDAAKKLLAEAEAEYAAYVAAEAEKEAQAEADLNAAIAAEKAKKPAKKLAQAAPITGEKEAKELRKAADKMVKKAVNKEMAEEANKASKTKAAKVKEAAKSQTKAPEAIAEADAAIEEAVESAPMAEIKAKRLAALRAKLPALRKDAATQVIENLSVLSFEEVLNLHADDLMVIKGVGAKYADAILSMRWDIADAKLVLADEYVPLVEGKTPPRQKEKLVFFDKEYNPAKKDNGHKIADSKDILRGQSELDRHMMSLGYDPYDIFITVCGYIESSTNPSSRETEQKAAWEKWTKGAVVLRNGKRVYETGFTARGGHKFVAVMHGTNAGRKDKVLFCREDAADEAIRFASNGSRWGAMSTDAKTAGYMGLVMPGTVPLSDIIGVEFGPEAVAITPSYTKVFKDQHVDFVDVETGVVDLDVVRNVVQKMTDGQSYFHVSDKMLTKICAGKTEEERRNICTALRKLKSFTIRAPWMKGLCLTTVDFHGVFKKLGVKFVKMPDGTIKDVEDIVFLMDETVFKAKLGEHGQFADWAEYCRNWHEIGHHFCVLITEHVDRPHTLPFQQLQSMVGAEGSDALNALISAEVAKINSYTNPDEAIKLLGGELAKIVRHAKGLLNYKWVQKRIEQIVAKLRAEATGGVLHGVTHNCFVAFDPIAHMQHIAWSASDMSEALQKQYPNEDDYVKGAIPANSVVCALKDAGAEGVMSRNPSTDAQAQCVVNVMKDFGGEWDQYIRWSTTCYTSVHSYEVTRIRGDHDGDHVCITFNKHIVSMAKMANTACGGRLIDWDAPGTAPQPVTLESMREYFAKLTQQSQLGHWCDMLTSLVGYGMAKYDHKVACWLTMAVNVFVDAAKHGMGDVAVPDFVVDFLYAKEKDGSFARDEDGARIQRPMPIYSMQAKDNRRPTYIDKKVGGKRCCNVHGRGNGDKLSFAVLTGTLERNVVDMRNVAPFVINDITYRNDPGREEGKAFGLRGCDKLFARGTYNKETGKYENQGLWIELCFEQSKELKALQDEYEADDDRFAFSAAKKSIYQFRRAAGIRRLTEWANENGKTIEDVCDAITYYTLISMKYPTWNQNASHDAASTLKYEKAVMAYNIKFDGWVYILGGLVLRAAYMRSNNPDVDIVDNDGWDDVMEEIA